MTRITPAEIAAERRLRLRVWVLLTLRGDELGAILTSTAPPTITELISLARKRAAELADAGSCQHCGAALPPPVTAKAKKRKKRKVFTPEKGG